MRFKQVGNKSDIVAVVIKNGESSATIPLGAPVCLTLNGTDDGLSVVLPSTGADVLQSSAAFGVALAAIAAGNYGEAQVFGFNSNTKLLRTRAASTDVFASIIQGALLKAESVSNCFVTVASNGASAFIPNAMLASTVAALATTAASTQVSTTQLVKAFLRMM